VGRSSFPQPPSSSDVRVMAIVFEEAAVLAMGTAPSFLRVLACACASSSLSLLSRSCLLESSLSSEDPFSRGGQDA